MNRNQLLQPMAFSLIPILLVSLFATGCCVATDRNVAIDHNAIDRKFVESAVAAYADTLTQPVNKIQVPKDTKSNDLLYVRDQIVNSETADALNRVMEDSPLADSSLREKVALIRQNFLQSVDLDKQAIMSEDNLRRKAILRKSADLRDQSDEMIQDLAARYKH